MGFQPSVVTPLLLFGAAVSLALAAVAWRRRTAGNRAFAVMLVAIAVWCIGDAGQYGATTMADYRLLNSLGMVGSAMVPTAALVFSLQYAGFEEWVTRRRVALLAVEPAATLVMLATNSRHHLMWRYVGELQTTPVADVQAVGGPWWTFHLAYSYAVVAATLGALGLFYLRSRGVYRRQATLIITGASVPLALNLLWLVGASPLPGVDLSSVAFALSGTIFAVALYRYDLLELSPVASHSLVEGLRDGVVAVDRQGRVAAANPVARRLLGDDVVGRAAADAVPRYDAVVESGDPEAGSDAGTVDVTLEVDGDPRQFEVSTSPLTDAGGEAGEALLLRDVTERRRVERRYQALIEKASDLTIVVGADGTSTFVSPSVEEVLGYDRAAVAGTDALEYVHPEDREEVADRLAAIADDPGAELRTTFRVRTSDGEYRVLEARGRNLLADDAVAGIVVNARDVTRRERRERALQRRNEQLEEFASVISHDLRNPMAVARGYAGALADDYDDDRIGKIVEAHERMDELLDDLLTLAREGRSVDAVEPVAVAEAARMAWATADTGDATLAVDAEATVLADGSRLRQLLENLFRNAADHGEAVTVTVGDLHNPRATGGAPDAEPAAGRSDGGPDVAGIYIADNGPGIPPEQRGEVFDAGVTTREDGTGFGLTIVRRIAEAHGWSVDVTESDAGGARFEVVGIETPD